MTFGEQPNSYSALARERKRGLGAFAEHALGGDAADVRIDDGLRNGEPVRLYLASGAIAAGAIVAAFFGLSVARCLVILTLSPTIMIVAYEGRGYRRQAEALATSLHQV